MNLVSDIGGTNIRLALVEPGSLVPCHIKTFKVLDFAGPAEAIKVYLAELNHPSLSRAVIAIATPIKGDLLDMTNNHWSFSVSKLKQTLQLEALSFVNDFNALAYSLPQLQVDELKIVGDHQLLVDRPKGLIGPGTGLGVSGLLPVTAAAGRSSAQHNAVEGVPEPFTWLALQGEGGHTTFNPRNHRQMALRSLLAEDYGHVSNERLLSGPGIEATYSALVKLDGGIAQSWTAAEISARALERSDKHCEESLLLFCECLGTCAADLALTLGAWGGVYIGGGIVPKLGDFFDTSPFRDSFEDKGRMGKLLRTTPTAVIMAEFATLKGAAVVLENAVVAEKNG